MAGQGEQPRFVHLKVHSAFSLLEGALPIERLAKLAKSDGMVALALTDTGNLFGALEFSEKLAGLGIQPLTGLTLEVDFADRQGDGEEPRGGDTRRGPDGSIALIAINEAGYRALMSLTSTSFLDSADPRVPSVTFEALAAAGAGLIALTGGPAGPIDRALANGQDELARARLERLAALYGDRLYVELQRHGLDSERAVEPELVGLAHALDLPLVATNEPYFEHASDYEAHDALICISEGRYVGEDDRRRLSHEHWFKSQREMALLFADLPEAIASTLEVARRCHYRPLTRKPILPQFVATRPGASHQAQASAEAAELRRQAEDGLRSRLEIAGLAPGVSAQAYWARLSYEVEIIVGMHYQGYFLIVSDFIKWAKAQGIPVGPGRGSGAGSVAAWALTITDLDPMRFGLLFERFLNPERVSMPDFDIDFCQDRRDEVIRYVQQKYGADRVAQIITYGKLQARAVLRDVGRVLQMPYGQVDRLCKLVPNNPASPVTLEQAIAGEPQLQEARDSEPVVAQLLGTAQKLEGLYRHASTHAAGVVIGDRPLVELVPLYRDPKSDLLVTQFNMKWVEAAGLVKFDFLGLKTLTVIAKAVGMVRASGAELDLDRLGLDDRASYELLSRGDTVGVFQLESTGMRDSLRRLKPDRFEDIIAMVALYRPGPMDNIPTYISRKAGLEPVDCLHEKLKSILSETYGVIIYQEQVMQIAQVLAGYSLGEADLLRRAMGKKIKEEMAAQKSRFVEGAVTLGVDQAQAETIFELVDKFAGYGFNKSHAAAYALIAYQTAYLKANHPREFIAASMTLDMASTDKLAAFCEEARRLGIVLRQPSINASGVDFLPEEGAIRYSLAALKNVGHGLVGAIEQERRARGPYRDLGDFARRLDAGTLNRRTLETLAAAGAFDDLVASRALVHANAENILSLASRTASDRAAGQNDLFAGGGGASEPLQLKPARAWTSMDALAEEFEAIGFYLSGHPLDEYGSILKRLGGERYAAFAAKVGAVTRQGIIAGIVTFKKERRSSKGNRYAFLGLSDQTSQFETIVFSDVLADAGALLEVGKAVLVHVEAERDGEVVKLRAQLIQGLDEAAGALRKGLRITLDERAPLQEIADLLGERGSGQIELVLRLPGSARDRARGATIPLPGKRDISPACASRLRAVPGVISVTEL